MNTYRYYIVPPKRILDGIHNTLMNTSSYFTGKLNAYNEMLMGKMDPSEDNPLMMKQIHIDFVEFTKQIGKFDKLVEFAEEYYDLPYHLRRDYLNRFFTLHFT